jgi:hypothetical protein
MFKIEINQYDLGMGIYIHWMVKDGWRVVAHGHVKTNRKDARAAAHAAIRKLRTTPANSPPQ